MQNCDCINQGFLCRAYWSECSKCYGTGIIKDVKNIGKDEFVSLHDSNSRVVLKELYSESHDCFYIHRAIAVKTNKYPLMRYIWKFIDGVPNHVVSRWDEIPRHKGNLFFAYPPTDDDIMYSAGCKNYYVVNTADW